MLSQNTSDSLDVLAVTREEVHCITLESPSALLGDLRATVTSHPRDNCWDDITGHAFVRNSQHEIDTLHLMMQMGVDDDIPGEAFSWPLDATKDPEPMEWTEGVQQYQSSFDLEHDLNGHVTAKMFGMAAAPGGDQTAVAFSVHPSRMIQYAIQAFQHTYIVFGNCQVDKDDVTELLRKTAARLEYLPNIQAGESGRNARVECYSTEALVLRLKTLFSALSTQRRSGDVLEPFQNLLGESGGSHKPESDAIDDGDRRKSVFRFTLFRQNMLTGCSSSSILHLRNTMITRADFMNRISLHVALAHTSMGKLMQQHERVSNSVLRRLHAIIAQLPTHVTSSSANQRTLRLYEAFAGRAQRADDDDPARVATTERDEASSVLEICEICGGNVPFESIHWARCSNNHRFGTSSDFLKPHQH